MCFTVVGHTKEIVQTQFLLKYTFYCAISIVDNQLKREMNRFVPE